MTELRHSDGLLRKALYGNALFSLVSGVTFIAFADLLSHLFVARDFVILGAGPSTILMELGLLILGFAALVMLAARQKIMNLIWSCLIIAADISWVLASAALLIFRPGLHDLCRCRLCRHCRCNS